MSVISAGRAASAFEVDEFDVPDEREAELPRGFEFVDGQLQERTVSQLSSYVAGRCYLKLANAVEATGLGWVLPEGTSYRCFPDDPTRIRRADTAFHYLGNLTAEKLMEEGHSTTVPDLVVEVISPNDLADVVNRKRIEWQRAGVALVWIVHPLDREIQAYTAGGVRLFTEADTLDAEPVLPDFRLPMAELFRMPGIMDAARKS